MNSSVSAGRPRFDSVLDITNQRRSQADDARVRHIIDLIKAPPSIQVTRTLTEKQFEQLLGALENPENGKLRPHLDGFRFDYTRSKKQFEIRIPTTMQGGIEDFIKEGTFQWINRLKQSNDANISNAAKTIVPSGHANVRLPYPEGPSDTKSPDWNIRHKMCESRCTYPTLVMELEWARGKKDLQAKAEAYICGTQGKIRTVVGILMHDIYLAERKNEKKLRELYLAEGVHATGLYSYCKNDTNKAGQVSLLVWRKKIQQNGSVQAECVQDEVFRDKMGNPAQLVSLRLVLQDFICESLAGNFQAPELKISSEDLCASIDEILMRYRQERDAVVKEKARKERNVSRRKQARSR
ncbi:hypothetical protein F4679DRAFT_595062 [Xylaria curta]|nr:hypothetical protein F4679DRAFT_595062 [Xylaria curta]